MNVEEKLNCSVYAFQIYENPNTNVKFLLFKGVGPIVDNKVEVLHQFDYLNTQKNYKKLRNYHDMINKFGKKPCRIVDVDYNIVSEKEYSSQDEIAKEFNIKLSRLAKKPFSEKDVVGTKRIIKYAN